MRAKQLRELVQQAAENVRSNAGRGDWYEGYKAGASAVMVELYRLEREQKKDPTQPEPTK